MTTRTFALDAPITLQCRFAVGSLTIEAVDGCHEARVDIRPQHDSSDIESRCTVALRGHTLLIAGPRPSGGLLDLASRHQRQDALEIAVRVPADTPIKIGTQSASLTTRGRLGSADITGGSLDARIEAIAGDLRLRYGSGPSQLGAIAGSVSIKNGNGDIRLYEVGRATDIALGSGSAELGTAHGSVRIRTGSGSVTVDRAEADLVMDSGSGDATVGIPAGVTARLDVLTGKGQLSTDMPVSTSAPAGRSTTVRVRTGRGDVSIRRTTDGTRLAG